MSDPLNYHMSKNGFQINQCDGYNVNACVSLCIASSSSSPDTTPFFVTA